MILYEFPTTERVRTLLRFEDLYERWRYFLSQTEPFAHHSALLTLFEMMEVGGRADLKSDLLQELERQKQQLETLRAHPHISEEALDSILAELEGLSSQLLEMNGRLGHALRENEWLMSIRQRTSIPGGCSTFDLPAYYYWQQQPLSQRLHDFSQWGKPFQTVYEASRLILRLLRESARRHSYIAKQGAFQQMSGGKSIQLIQILVHDHLPCVPEISANKYAINLRFVLPIPTETDKNRAFIENVPFEMACCTLSC